MGQKTYQEISLITAVGENALMEIAKPMLDSGEIKAQAKPKRGMGIVVTARKGLYEEAEPEEPTELQVATRNPREVKADLDEQADLKKMAGEVWD